MTYEWCDWIPDAVRSDPFVYERTIFLGGNEARGRPGSFFPSGVVDHHTACMMRIGHDPQVDINVNLKGNSVAPGPISQALGTWTPPGVKWTGNNPDPRLIIVARGRANHAGATEYRWGAPGGNGSSFGNEWCGPSEDFDWPDIVLELRARWDACILRTTGWSIEHLTTHNECAVPHGRKIDPSGGWTEEPDLGYLEPWNADKWRGFVVPFLFTPSPKPDPQPKPDGRTFLLSTTGDESDVSYEILDYGIRPNTPFPEDQGKPTDGWWTEFGITTRGLCWSGAPQDVDVPSFVYHQMAEIQGNKPMLRIQNDNEMIQWMQRYGTTGPVPSTFANNKALTDAWKQHSNDN